MKQFILVTTLLLASLKTLAYNPFWIQKDKKLISTLTKINKNNSQDIEQYFKSQLNKTSLKKENLGFGWTMSRPGIGGGYIAISAEFFYYHDSLVCYSLTPELPEERGLKKRYKKWYGEYFYYSNSEIQTFRFNIEAILRPLKEYTGNLTNISPKLLNYMSPNSGTTYGYAGSMGILENRKAFFEIQDSLNYDNHFLLMFSINPASRLTAIEYYLKREFNIGDQKMLNSWIEQNYKEIPNVEIGGCYSYLIETRSLVYMLSRKTDK